MYIILFVLNLFPIIQFRLTNVSELEVLEEFKTVTLPIPVAKETHFQENYNPPATGIDVLPRLTPGTRVQRGPDWKWGDQVHVFVQRFFMYFVRKEFNILCTQ